MLVPSLSELQELVIDLICSGVVTSSAKLGGGVMTGYNSEGVLEKIHRVMHAMHVYLNLSVLPLHHQLVASVGRRINVAGPAATLLGSGVRCPVPSQA